jgi:hypothetical protein
LTTLGRSARSRLRQRVLVFTPETFLTWHRELFRRTWTCTRRRTGGRPPITAELEALILQLAKENPRWAYSKLHGEVRTVGYDLGRTTVRTILKRHRVPPRADRAKHGSRWRSFLGHSQDQILACDFFTAETVWRKTIEVLLFIELGTRRVHLAGCTATPTTAWVTQQARQMRWELDDRAMPMRVLILDEDPTFSAAFDTVFAAEDSTIIRTPGYPLGVGAHSQCVW